MSAELERAAARHRRAKATAATAYADLLNVVLEEAGQDGANVRELARRAGITHGTIYNELERRRDGTDT